MGATNKTLVRGLIFYVYRMQITRPLGGAKHKHKGRGHSAAKNFGKVSQIAKTNEKLGPAGIHQVLHTQPGADSILFLLQVHLREDHGKDGELHCSWAQKKSKVVRSDLVNIVKDLEREQKICELFRSTSGIDGSKNEWWGENDDGKSPEMTSSRSSLASLLYLFLLPARTFDQRWDSDNLREALFA